MWCKHEIIHIKIINIFLIKLYVYNLTVQNDAEDNAKVLCTETSWVKIKNKKA